jgi:hypothetical protein
MTDTIAPEIGKFYRTRDGYRCGPIDPLGLTYDGGPTRMLSGWIPGTGGRAYHLDGRHFYGNASLDLVAEWTDVDDADEVVHNRIVDEFTDNEQAASARWPEETSEAQTLVDAQYAPDVTAAEEAEIGGRKFTDYGWVEVKGSQSTADTDATAADIGQGPPMSHSEEDSYRELHTQVPPVLEIENGRLVIKLVHENLTLTADVGDGRFFFSQVIAKLVDPALLAAHKTAKFVREYAAPND